MLVHDQLVQPTTDSNLRTAVARSAHHAAAPERKACRSCRVVKPIVDYAVDRSRRTGYAGICKVCDCTRSSARYYRNTPRGRLTA